MNILDIKTARLAKVLNELLAAAVPFSTHDWMDAELEDDSCKLTQHSGSVTVGDWRKLRRAVDKAVVLIAEGDR